MTFVLDRVSSTRCALDAARSELFTQKKFSDLINEYHSDGKDYYLARVHCKETTEQKVYYCYDAKALCKYVFEMIVNSEGRKICIKNFRDPINQKEISEINFFRLRHDSETPLKAEYVSNHVSFLESAMIRNRIFGDEDPLEALSVNFQLSKSKKIPLIRRRQLIDIFIFLILLLIMGALLYFGIKSKSIGFGSFKKINDVDIPKKP